VVDREGPRHQDFELLTHGHELANLGIGELADPVSASASVAGDERVAVVTAASRGLGRASVVALAEEGVRLVVNARSVGQLESLRDELDVEIEIVAGDVTEEGSRTSSRADANSLCRKRRLAVPETPTRGAGNADSRCRRGAVSQA
jgi:hypothetical protein